MKRLPAILGEVIWGCILSVHQEISHQNTQVKELILEPSIDSENPGLTSRVREQLTKPTDMIEQYTRDEEEIFSAILRILKKTVAVDQAAS